MRPNFREEKKLWKKEYKRVACLDEAGRGCLAGPVVACAVMVLNPKHEARWMRSRLPVGLHSKQIQNSNFLNLKHVSDFGFRILSLKLRDSKQLTPKARDKFYEILTTDPRIWWGIGRVSEKVIDKINILEATKLAMVRAINSLEKKLKKELSSFRSLAPFGKIDFLILDGNFKIDLPISQKSIVKADEKIFSCAAASILAKVTRDSIMMRYHKKYPQYGFAKHKGYPTKSHLKMLKIYGPCQIHRKSFKPVAKLLKR